MLTFEEITANLLDPSSDFGVLNNSIQQLHNIYAEHSGVKAGDVTDSHIMLPSGQATGTTAAAHCLLETIRTTNFIRSIYKAIRQLQQTFEGEQVHILYAGCGPYATLLTSLTAVSPCSEVAFHLLDINPVSLEAVRKLYESMGISEYVGSYTLHDATTYTIPKDRRIHLAVSETMLNALRKEPQVAITLNIVPQLMPGALFIPQNIRVSALAVNRSLEFKSLFNIDYVAPHRIALGTIYDIGQENCAPHQPISFTLPNEDEYDEVVMHTDISLFDDEILTFQNCSLNVPVKVCEIGQDKGKQITFSYKMGVKPQFEHDIN